MCGEVSLSDLQEKDIDFLQSSYQFYLGNNDLDMRLTIIEGVLSIGDLELCLAMRKVMMSTSVFIHISQVYDNTLHRHMILLVDYNFFLVQSEALNSVLILCNCTTLYAICIYYILIESSVDALSLKSVKTTSA